jgi:hypothetical protein
VRSSVRVLVLLDTHLLSQRHYLHVMVPSFTSPLLSLAADAIQDLDGADAITGLLTSPFLLTLYPLLSSPFPFSISLYQMQRVHSRRSTSRKHLLEALASPSQIQKSSTHFPTLPASFNFTYLPSHPNIRTWPRPFWHVLLALSTLFF